MAGNKDMDFLGFLIWLLPIFLGFAVGWYLDDIVNFLCNWYSKIKK